MLEFLNPPLTPRNGHTLEILVACRVSDPRPGKQDERSLDDQEVEHREWVKVHTDLPFNITVVAGSGSGEWLERDEYLQLIDLVGSRRFDLVLIVGKACQAKIFFAVMSRLMIFGRVNLDRLPDDVAFACIPFE